MLENCSQFQVGNWVVYLPGGNYCTVKSLSPRVVLNGALSEYLTSIECLGKIKITADKLQVCGFDVQSPRVIKKATGGVCVSVVISFSGVHKLYKDDEEFCTVEFIHQVQNAYYEITGELLQGNLYGVREN